MDEFEVFIERPAEQDLLALLNYITHILKEPDTAKRIYRSIREQILGLSQMPERCPVVQEEPYATMGIRKLLVENYIAFYFVAQETRRVHVIRILYNRRDWKHLL